MFQIKVAAEYSDAVVSLKAAALHRLRAIQGVGKALVVTHAENAFVLYYEEDARVQVPFFVRVSQIPFRVETLIYKLHEPEWLDVNDFLWLVRQQIDKDDFLVLG